MNYTGHHRGRTATRSTSRTARKTTTTRPLAGASSTTTSRGAGGDNNNSSDAQLLRRSSSSEDNDSPVVAALPQKSPHPYSSISMQPTTTTRRGRRRRRGAGRRLLAVTACKDTLQIVQIDAMQGLKTIKTIACSQFFAQTTSAAASAAASSPAASRAPPNKNPNRMYEEMFGFGGVVATSGTSVGVAAGAGGGGGGGSHQKPHRTGGAGPVINVVITDVAWSMPQEEEEETEEEEDEEDESNNFSSATTDASQQHCSSGEYHHHHHRQGKNQSGAGNNNNNKRRRDSSLIAAAGSNGVIVVWTAESLLEGGGTNATPAAAAAATTTTTTAASKLVSAPEAVLSQHARAVNRLAWHPTKPGLLLSASQDSTVRLWERKRQEGHKNNNNNKLKNVDGGGKTGGTGGSSAAATTGGSQHYHPYAHQHEDQQQQQQQHQRGRVFLSLFGGSHVPYRSSSVGSTASGHHHGANRQQQYAKNSKAALYTWQCKNIYEPKSEAVRDLQWSRHFEDLFALVTASGSLVVYNRHVRIRAVVKMTAHSGDATTLDWHPALPFVVATGGATDRCVKIWNLQKDLADAVVSTTSSSSTAAVHTSTNSKSSDESTNNANTVSSVMMHHISANNNTLNSRAESINTEASDVSDRSSHCSAGGSSAAALAFRTLSSTTSVMFSSSTRQKPKSMLHVLSISASVTRIKWRPPARQSFGDLLNRAQEAGPDSGGGGAVTTVMDEQEDRHQSMLAVATAPIKGASAGGSGLIALWSFYRPFMPLSVVEGHKEGAVTDFEWLDTPSPVTSSSSSPMPQQPASSSTTADALQQSSTGRQREGGRQRGSKSANPARTIDRASASSFQPSGGTNSLAFRQGARFAGTSETASVDSMSHYSATATSTAPDHSLLTYQPGDFQEYGASGAVSLGADPNPQQDIGIWQHVLSVGRDGRCLIQSLVRGDRPISRVPPSCFAMANLSPFQRGCGSLQIFSVSQRVPSSPQHEFLLTGLRRDSITAAAPGVFCEVIVEGNTRPPGEILGQLPPPQQKQTQQGYLESQWVAARRLPATVPEITFHVVDQGELDPDSKPLLPPVGTQQSEAITVAPEVVHLSRFASNYKFHPDPVHCQNRIDLCLHNGEVAESLRCDALAHMWRMVASMLESSGMDTLPDDSTMQQPGNVMQFVILQTIENLLLERAEEGDVQTCVALCEVLQVVKGDGSTRIPGLDSNLVRQWYLSYIDLLRDMCLFSHASFVIRNSNDPFISALNQQSTTIHESCPHCGKAIHADQGAMMNPEQGVSARRICRSCRRRVGMCFLCHEPVKGMYVWCPGCGHGGHLEHALSWFGGLTGNPVREVCPTGCGHRCNFLQPLNAFPRTDSLLSIDRIDQCLDL